LRNIQAFLTFIFLQKISMTKILKTLFLCFSAMVCFAQNDTIPLTATKVSAAMERTLFIKNIKISGNKHTKNNVIVREMSLKAGDTVHLYNLMPRMQRDERLLMNLSLFNWAKLNATDWKTDQTAAGIDSISLSVDLEESLAFYPVPVAEIADRNFYIWLNDYKAALWRVNWILKLTHFNVTGRGDRLAALIQFGYSDKFQLTYRSPYLDKAGTMRATVSGFYARAREVQADTRGSKQVFLLTDNEYPLTRYRATAELSIRPAYRAEHIIGAKYFYNAITDTLNKTNQQFFDGQKTQQYAQLSYNFRHDTRDIRPYPGHGHLLNTRLEYDGLGSGGSPNRLAAEAEYWQYFSAGSRWTFETGGNVHTTLTAAAIPFYNRHGLGYTDEQYIRGYDKYVLDGQDWAFAKASARYKFMEFTYDFGEMMPIKSIRYMPIRLHATVNGDAAYVRDRFFVAKNPFANRFLYGTGVGIDCRVWFENVFSFEYLINHQGERDVFFRVRIAW
jgi:outer membrane protein assembly factor BamA